MGIYKISNYIILLLCMSQCMYGDHAAAGVVLLCYKH